MASFDDDEFDDDTFDNLPASTLQALESKALVGNRNAVYPPRTNVQNVYSKPTNATVRPPLSTVLPQRQNSGGSAKLDGGAEEVINLDDYSHARPNNYSQYRMGTQTNRYPRPSGSASKNGVNVPFRLPGRPSQSSQPSKPQVSVGTPDIVALQAQIQKLEKEKAELKELADTAESRAQARTGEASILRQRIEKTTREYEHQLESLRQTHTDTAAKQRAELEAAQKQKERVETDKRFLEHDLAVEVSKGRQLRKVPAVVRSHTLPENHRKSALSPRKTKALGLGDGFDNEQPQLSPSHSRTELSHSFHAFDDNNDMQMPSTSPSKSWNGNGGKLVTPSKRAEKKRKLGDISPAIQRSFLVEEQVPGSSPIHLFSPDPSFDDLQEEDESQTHPDSEQLDFMRSLLFYRLEKSQERFFDVMKHYKFGFSDLPLSTWIMDSWDQSVASKDVAMDFCRVVCSIWDTCLEQKLYGPIDGIVDIIHFATSKRDPLFSQQLVSRILPPAMKSINAVAFPIASDRMDDSGPMEPVTNIDTQACLGLLLSIAQACIGSKEATTEFWRTLTLHWTLVLLFPMQPLHHLSMTCALLRTSALDSSFGPIFQSTEFDSVKDQADLEQILVDRLTSLLSVDPQSSDEVDDISFIQVLEFRLEVLRTLTSICTPPHNGLSIAKHKDAIGRIMQFLLEAVNYLYLPDTIPAESHDLAIDCVNGTMRILYAVLTTHASKIDVHEKLKAVEGGAHMQLLALTRIAFCESVVLERGIDPTVSDAAHALLDEFLSPVEGDQLLKMFPSVESTALGNDAHGNAEYDAAHEADEAALAAETGADEAMDLS
jgi:hypothetical protein